MGQEMGPTEQGLGGRAGATHKTHWHQCQAEVLGNGVFVGQWAQQGVGRQCSSGGSRQGIDSRTNACNFITNLSMSIRGHLWGCSQAIWL